MLHCITWVPNIFLPALLYHFSSTSDYLGHFTQMIYSNKDDDLFPCLLVSWHEAFEVTGWQLQVKVY